jgi:hypothetical protein
MFQGPWQYYKGVCGDIGVFLKHYFEHHVDGALYQLFDGVFFFMCFNSIAT